MSESHFDEYEHYNYDQDKAMFSGHSGKQRSKKEAEQNTNRYKVEYSCDFREEDDA